MLHSQRKRRADRDAREAEGENLWVEDVPQAARVKIATFWALLQEKSSEYVGTINREVADLMRLGGGYNVRSIDGDSLIKATNADVALDVIGSFALYVKDGRSISRFASDFDQFVNTVFEDYRVAYRMVDQEVIPIGSDELHTEVVAPALRLLVGAQFSKAHAAYLDALKEIPASPANAITDAGTALQEVLTAVGCAGNALGPLIKSAKKKGLLAPHDDALNNGLENFLNWASADRSQTGDGHHVSDATRADAWLMVHIVGALIVRLVDPSKRSTSGI
ncbi:hypothetical protein [Phycicoccus sp. Soil802]|uniref:hypothetical protein n=1 Tax=Phycicoccus sp. Soil802 TaxID=1736414 RepID=UPI000A7E561A|nr:hypothetical protein [Phycicoccus sp. Soil802]